MLETKLNGIENKIDDIEQYGRRSNLRFTGIGELPQGEDLESKLLDIANNDMGVTPPYSPVTSNVSTDWVARLTTFDRGQ